MKKHFSKGIIIALILATSAFSNDEREATSTKSFSLGINTVHAATAPPTSGTDVLKGKVMETMDSGGYTYLKIDTGSSQPWIAIPQSSVKVGEEVNCSPGMEMKNFSSKTLNRTFDSVIFSGGLIVAAQAATPGGMINPHKTQQNQEDDSFASAVKAEGGTPAAQLQTPQESGGSMGAMAPYSAVTVAKATGENGYTVEEIFTKTEELNGKTVRIQGKIVKFSPMIMGRNWIHLQDGTGDPMNSTHDLVVTTSETLKIDDIVTVEGVLAANKDFGAGYKYVAIVEEAKSVK